MPFTTTPKADPTKERQAHMQTTPTYCDRQDSFDASAYLPEIKERLKELFDLTDPHGRDINAVNQAVLKFIDDFSGPTWDKAIFVDGCVRILPPSGPWESFEKQEIERRTYEELLSVCGVLLDISQRSINENRVEILRAELGTYLGLSTASTRAGGGEQCEHLLELLQEAVDLGKRRAADASHKSDAAPNVQATPAAKPQDAAVGGDAKPHDTAYGRRSETAGAGTSEDVGADLDSFDVFLCYNSADRPGVEELAKKLEYGGLTVWVDKESLALGRSWQRGIERGIERSSSVAVCVGQAGIGQWQDQEIQHALNRAIQEDRAVIPVLLPGAVDGLRLPFPLGNYQWVDFHSGFNDSELQRLIRDINKAAGKRTDGMKWPEAASLLEQMRQRRERYTSREKLAERLRCSPATIQKAIDRTPTLKEWATRPVSSALRKPSIDDPDNPVLDSTPQNREPNPAEIVEQTDLLNNRDALDAALQYCIDQAPTADVRAQIHALMPDERDTLAKEAWKHPDRADRILRDLADRIQSPES